MMMNGHNMEPVELSRQYYEELHRVTVRRGSGDEPLGLTVKEEGNCVVVSRILEGGMVDRTGQIDLGDIVVEVRWDDIDHYR